jgi:hypothetical protein
MFVSGNAKVHLGLHEDIMVTVDIEVIALLTLSDMSPAAIRYIGTPGHIATELFHFEV